jgi:hypothetical protein
MIFPCWALWRWSHPTSSCLLRRSGGGVCVVSSWTCIHMIYIRSYYFGSYCYSDQACIICLFLDDLHDFLQKSMHIIIQFREAQPPFCTSLFEGPFEFQINREKKKYLVSASWRWRPLALEAQDHYHWRLTRGAIGGKWGPRSRPPRPATVCPSSPPNLSITRSRLRKKTVRYNFSDCLEAAVNPKVFSFSGRG